MEQHALPAADQLGRLTRLVHDCRRQRASLRRDRERRQCHQVRVALEEELLEEHLAREAGARVVLAAVDLREHLAEELLIRRRVHQVVLEVVALDVEYELLAGERLARSASVFAGALVDRVRAARFLVARVEEASLQRQERGGRRGDGEHEVAPRKAEALGVAFTSLARLLDRLALDRRQWRRYVLPVRAWPELDRQAGIVSRRVSHARIRP